MKKIFNYDDVAKISMNYAMYKLNNKNEAKNISQKVTSEFILKDVKGSYKELRSWSFGTTKNMCNKLFRERTNTTSMTEELLIEVLLPEEESNWELREAFRKAYSTLKKEELELLVLYDQTGHSFVQMSELTDKSVGNLQQKIKRIKKHLKATTNLNMGIVCTKKIVTPALDNVLYKFLKSLRENMNAGTLYKMHYYFSKDMIKKIDDTMDIVETINYEIAVEDGIYSICVLYMNSIQETNAFEFSFMFEANRLKVTKAPFTRKLGFCFVPGTPAYEEFEQLRKLYPPDKSGKSTVPQEQIEAIIKKYKKQKK